MASENKLQATVYYTPINDPDKIEKIAVQSDNDFNIIKGFIKRNTKRRKKPNLESFQSSGLYDIKILHRIRNEFPTIKDLTINELFSSFSFHMRTSAKSKEKYFALIVNSDFIFVYHFKPEKSITFRKDAIEEVIKYLDSSTINWFFFITNNEELKEYYDFPEEEEMPAFDTSDEDLIYCYEKQATQGFKELSSREPIYDAKGDIKIRCEYDSETDVVIETHLEHLANLDDSLSLDLTDGKIKINGLNIPIKEVQIDDKKYGIRDIDSIYNHITYNSLDIKNIVLDYEFYSNKNRTAIIIEEIDRILISADEQKTPISKPSKKLDQKNTIYILGESKYEISNDYLLNNLINTLEKQSKLSIVELSKHNEKYGKLNISDISLFLKFKKTEEANQFAEQISELGKKLDSPNNLFYKKFLSLLGLMAFKDYIKTSKVSSDIHKASKHAMTNLLAEQNKSIDLKEIDRVGIEFKAGVLESGKGFFDPSPDKFVKKVIEKTKGKRLDLIIYLIGINEGTNDFSLISINRMRNEFRDSVKEKLSENGLKPYLIESLPVSDKEGVLLLVVEK